MRLGVLLVLVFAVLSGCGYHLPGQGSDLPGNIRTLYIELFTNQTFEPSLENLVTNDLSEQFARKRSLRLVEDPSRADAVLSGAIAGYSTAAASYDRTDRITEYRATMKVSAVLRRFRDDKILWKGTVSWSEEYPADLDKAAQEDNEAAAIERISERVAEELFFRITDNF